MAEYCTCDVEVCEMHTPKGSSEQKPIDWRDYFEGPFRYQSLNWLVTDEIGRAVCYIDHSGESAISDDEAAQVGKIVVNALNAEWEKGRKG